MSILEVSNLCKKYPNQHCPVLDGISFSVEKNSIFVILGKSGSGKSTLLNLIAGLDIPDAGQICIDGKVMFDRYHFVTPELRKIGMVFQDHSLFPHRNVFDNIAFGLHQLSKQQKKVRVQEMLALIELTGFGQKYPHELSGGETQRVALARSLAPYPKILLMDEPFSKIDVILKSDIRSKVKDILQQTNTTTVLVTHDREDVFSMADRLLVLNRGQIGQIGIPSEIYETPQDYSIANMLGKTNKLPATLTAKGYQTVFGILPVKQLCVQQEQQGLQLILRPECFTVDTGEGITGIVEQVDFWGKNRKIVVRINDFCLTLSANKQLDIKPGMMVKIKLNLPSI